ncbi:hypothetical protein QBC46DRAFT_413442 [Diplogelasinospora grovesii]|uniref:Uncharacterized protein n=1 Tax=Diplogelasinospora grovesii TaxID=303347 RepID=A0AAN6RZJ3_9PEZI|nr:hypothetical protein QBC46DRAFT_413442 [Diplogelasinospora grovesii]
MDPASSTLDDDMLSALSAKDDWSCLAICQGLNLPSDCYSSARPWHLSSETVKNSINGPIGDKFITDLVDIIRGPLPPKRYIIKIITLLICYRARERTKCFFPIENRNYLLQFDSILHRRIDNVQLIGEVLERVVYSTIRAANRHYPEIIDTPGLLPTQLDTCMMDSPLSAPLDLYCCIRSLFLYEHEPLMRVVQDIVKAPPILRQIDSPISQPDGISLEPDLHDDDLTESDYGTNSEGSGFLRIEKDAL